MLDSIADLQLCLFSRRSLYGLYPYKSSMIGLENLGDPSGNWDIVETIGTGTYGKVYRVTNKKDGSQAAVKVLDPINVREAWLLWKLHNSEPLYLLYFMLSIISGSSFGNRVSMLRFTCISSTSLQSGLHCCRLLFPDLLCCVLFWSVREYPTAILLTFLSWLKWLNS